MYPSSPPYRPMAPGLARYGSAPSSLLNRHLQSLVPNSGAGFLAQFFPAAGSSDRTEQNSSGSQLERSSSYGTPATASSLSPTGLARHSSFPTSDTLSHIALGNNGESPTTLFSSSSSSSSFFSSRSSLRSDSGGIGRRWRRRKTRRLSRAGRRRRRMMTQLIGVVGPATSRALRISNAKNLCRKASRIETSLQIFLFLYSGNRVCGNENLEWKRTLKITGCNGGYGTGSDVAKRMLKPQRSFSRQESKLGDVSRMGTSWNEESSTVVFSAPPNKRGKDINGDILAALDHIDVELYGALPHKTIEMATLESFLQLRQDAVPCKIRAKRGCATHPRSVAERHRRTRISEKLRKVQELVPNMEKQTNTAEMLDLAVQHIKYLQNEIQKLQRERSNCCCGSKN